MKNSENDKEPQTPPSDFQGQRYERGRKTSKRTQGQMIQAALGLAPQLVQEIEKKLFIARFLDFFSEETLDFVYKERSIDQYKNEIHQFLNPLNVPTEEDKLLKKSFEDKKILDVINNLKKNAEKLAASKGFTQPIDKKLRNMNLIVTIPMFGLLIFLMFLPSQYMLIIFPILCLFCMAPQFIRASIIKKWFNFKESNRHEFYTENRDDILILKDYTGELLENIRARLLDLKVPLQLIKFVLHSRDYENLKLINQRTIRGLPQYFFSFEYPPGMKPFPIPEMLQNLQQPMFREPGVVEKPEKNFIVLKDVKAKDGIINSFVPTLKSFLADKINELLNNCDFTRAPRDFTKIIPKYSPDIGIYCVCGEIAEIINTQICNWKNQLKFYLFEGKSCDCGETIYALSIMDDSDEIPEDLKEIFSN